MSQTIFHSCTIHIRVDIKVGQVNGLSSGFKSNCTGRSSENICSSAVEALRNKQRKDETQFTTKIGGKTSLCPSYFILQNFHSWLCV
jgi:hypothetical protein